jgi:hypothetical protein
MKCVQRKTIRDGQPGHLLNDVVGCHGHGLLACHRNCLDGLNCRPFGCEGQSDRGKTLGRFGICTKLIFKMGLIHPVNTSRSQRVSPVDGLAPASMTRE